MSNRFWGAKLLPSAFLALSLAACQSESPVLETSTDNMSEITLTGTISKGEMNTRTNLGLDDNGQTLIMTWNMGEYIHVSYKDGTYLGHLEVTGFADEAHTLANFVGKIKAIPTNGDHDVYFYTLGSEHEYTGERGEKMTEMSYDFENQTSTDANALAAHDLMLTPGVIHVNGGNATFENLRLKRQFAFGRFTLLYDGTPLSFGSEGAVVTIDTEAEDIKTGATISFPENITASRGEEAIKVSASQNDFYVTFVPGSAEGKIKFNVTVNGEKYEGYTNRTHLIDKNKFFRKNEGGAYPINVKHVDGSDDQFKLTHHTNIPNKEWSYTAYGSMGASKDAIFTVVNYSDISEFTNFQYDGYHFLYWSDNADGSGATYNADDQITLRYDENVGYSSLRKDIYAIWEKDFDYKVILKYSDTDKREIPQTSPEASIKVSLPGKDNPTPTKEGAEFLGWVDEDNPNGEPQKDSWTLTKDKPSVTLIPKFNDYPGLINQGYGPGTWGK